MLMVVLSFCFVALRTCPSHFKVRRAFPPPDWSVKSAPSSRSSSAPTQIPNLAILSPQNAPHLASFLPSFALRTCLRVCAPSPLSFSLVSPCVAFALSLSCQLHPPTFNPLFFPFPPNPFFLGHFSRFFTFRPIITPASHSSQLTTAADGPCTPSLQQAVSPQAPPPFSIFFLRSPFLSPFSTRHTSGHPILTAPSAPRTLTLSSLPTHICTFLLFVTRLFFSWPWPLFCSLSQYPQIRRRIRSTGTTYGVQKTKRSTGPSQAFSSCSHKLFGAFFLSLSALVSHNLIARP